MRKFGPLVLGEDFHSEEENLTVFGPLTSTGDVKVKSLKAFGPVTIKGSLTTDKLSSNGPAIIMGEVLSNQIKVNGPLRVSGNLTLAEGKINGPLVVSEAVEVAEYLKLNGPLEAESVVGKYLAINGKIQTTGLIEASEEIVISIGRGKNQIIAEGIKAPKVTIKRGTSSFFSKVFDLIRGRSPNFVNELDVPIEAETIMFEGVKYSGLLKASSVNMDDDSEIIELLDEAAS